MKIASKYEGDIQTFSEEKNKKEPRIFVKSKTAQQEILKKILQAEGNDLRCL